MSELENNETYLLQQDNIESNWWECSKCKFEFYWGEDAEDIKTSDLCYCPRCGKKIKEYVFVEEDEDE